MGSEEAKPHLFVMRIWVDPEQAPAGLSRGLIEHVPSGERRYFRDLGEIQTFIAGRLAAPDAAAQEDFDAT